MESCDQEAGPGPTDPTRDRAPLCPEESLLVVVMGADDPCKRRHLKEATGLWVQTVCWVPLSMMTKLWTCGSRLRGQAPRECGRQRARSYALYREVHLPFPPLLPAAATRTFVLIQRCLCWRTITNGKVSPARLGGRKWQLEFGYPRWLPRAPSLCLRGEPKTGSTRSLWRCSLLPCWVAASVNRGRGGRAATCRAEGKPGLLTLDWLWWPRPSPRTGKAECPRTPLLGGPRRLLSTYLPRLEMKGKERHQSLCHLIPSPEEVELGTCMLFQTLSANHSAHCVMQISKLRSSVTWVISSLVGMKTPYLPLFLTLAVCGASCAS